MEFQLKLPKSSTNGLLSIFPSDFEEGTLYLLFHRSWVRANLGLFCPSWFHHKSYYNHSETYEVENFGKPKPGIETQNTTNSFEQLTTQKEDDAQNNKATVNVWEPFEDPGPSKCDDKRNNNDKEEQNAHKTREVSRG